MSPSVSLTVAILDLPSGSTLTLDGQVRVLQRDDFVGIRGISVGVWHLVVIQAAAAAATSHGAGTVPVGFVVMTHSPASSDELCLVRRYDASTEEVSWEPVDSITVSNLQAQLDLDQLRPPRMIDYQDLVPADQTCQWQQATQFINTALLETRNLHHGDKIVPGSYTCTSTEESDTAVHAHTNRDGSCISYPPIPVLLAAGSKTPRHYSNHAGTKLFLTTLTPSERTALFLTNPPCMVSLVLHKYYQDDWNQLLGDLQLAHLVFIQLHCLASFEHWRDLTAMLCQEPLDDTGCFYIQLYTHLFSILAQQIMTVDSDFFDNDTTDDNFLLPCLQRLCQSTASIRDANLQAARTQFCRILENRFPTIRNNVNDIMVQQEPFMNDDEEDDNMDSDEGEEDSPVMVSLEDYEASLARTSSLPLSNCKDPPIGVSIPLDIQLQYPILFAAQQDHEDILMTCARALHDKNDVSLVREAADFLIQQVEPSANSNSHVNEDPSNLL
jgi:AAR2 protein